MKILIAVDDSACSRAVVMETMNLRCPKNTKIRVMSAADVLGDVPSMEGIRRREIADKEILVHRIIEKLRLAHPEAVVTGAVMKGYATDEILNTCDEWQPDLLLLGSHGRSGIEYLLLGSVSRTIFLEAPCAVRIVRSKTLEHQESGSCNVIMALDNSEHSKNLIDHALQFPWSANAKFKCIHVVRHHVQIEKEKNDATVDAYNIEFVRGTKAWLEVAAQKLNDYFGKPVAEAQVLEGEPRKVIMDTAKNWPADLIMVGSHGRRGIDRAIIGSVSEAVAMHAPCSVEMTRIKTLAKRKIHVIV